MNKQYRVNRIIYILVLFAILSLIGIHIMNIYVDNLSKEYSFDIRNEKDINEEVVKIIPWHGVTNVQLSNGKKYWIDMSYNYDYRSSFIGDNIKLGDSIIKKANSDSLWVKSSKGEFVFVVGERINPH